MPEISAILSLPYIQPGQAQKHVTHNEAIKRLDALVQPVVADRDRAAPPDDPAPGARHLVATGASGDWAGQSGRIAVWDGTAWGFETPLPGWRLHCLAEGADLRFDGTGWTAEEERPLRAASLGINTGPDDTDRLSLAAPSTLLNHAGGDHRLKINRAGAGDTASLLFQTGFAGGAEIGLAGGAGFAIRTSADGADWTTALGLSAQGLASGAAVQSAPDDATPGRLMTVGAFGLGAAAPVLLDADAGRSGGVFAIALPATGTPGETSGPGLLWVAAAGPDAAAQRLCETVTGRVWRRALAGGVWQGWRREIGQADLLGPVSLADGLPGGAVFDSGESAEGRYLRFADGTQIAWTGAAGFARISEHRLEHVWTFPAPFADTPRVSATLPGAEGDFTALDPGDLGGLMQEAGAASAALRLPRAAGAAGFAAAARVANVGLTALGRWAA
ncbi:hypothetical protein FHS00_001495 [Limimaricola variabilis]|uniref:DUF2793 domain-containing protein n=1 Tax=Limimaricola variabilis TaxID=1492771 RepID=A0ABR6HMY6_9RHOB|nr:DUF2793 domain-containing protein [Limimaricola variabilis]MBB3711919.1 hypothetical protein [Limimaricola variabilis]